MSSGDNSAQNDVPAYVTERLGVLKGDSTHDPLFTSDLSVNELLLVREAGYEPVGMVVGSSIYHIGYAALAGSFKQNQEITTLSQAMYHARELAMTRMEAEARALKADGVVGVRLIVNRREWGEHIAEFVAIGTAICSRDGKSEHGTDGVPFTSDLSGQDFWTLRRAGFRPLGLVMGSCVYWVALQSIGKTFRQAGQNVELENYTQAMYNARELAMERMQTEATALKARGIVGAQVQEFSHGWEPHVIEFFSVGTAVAPIKEAQPVPAPAVVVALNDAIPQ
jgi:uncharacterized protein YbjQ (UPF0145 family)